MARSAGRVDVSLCSSNTISAASEGIFLQVCMKWIVQQLGPCTITPEELEAGGLLLLLAGTDSHVGGEMRGRRQSSRTSMQPLCCLANLRLPPLRPLLSST